MSQIYILIFVSGHYYIGRSKNYKVRFKKHCTLLRSGKHPNKFMQSVYNLHALPKQVLLLHCIDAESAEQALLNWNYGKQLCLNLNSSSRGGDGRNSTPPILRRDDTKRCTIKTKDLPNIERLLRVLNLTKVATYYNVHKETLRRLCKHYSIAYTMEYVGPKSNTNNLTLSTEHIVEFILDSAKMTKVALAKKYSVGRSTIYYWQAKYQADLYCRYSRLSK